MIRDRLKVYFSFFLKPKLVTIKKRWEFHLVLIILLISIIFLTLGIVKEDHIWLLATIGVLAFAILCFLYLILDLFTLFIIKIVELLEGGESN